MKVNKTTNNDIKRQSKGHLNHMSGISYDIQDPIKQLKIIASSSFFGEPMYYHRDNISDEPVFKNVKQHEKYLDKTLHSVIDIPHYHNYSPAKLMETAIDLALDFDIEETLKIAAELRSEDNIRTTPQVIMVRAGNHKYSKNTGLVKKYAQDIMKRTDEASLQLAYQMQVYGKPIPSALRKSWKQFLENRNDYELAKYKMENREFKTVDVVNMVHAFSKPIDLLMKGELKLSEEDTWEALISKNGSNKENWIKAIDLMGHMALLRNINNFIKNEVDTKLYLPKLVNTTKNGKQLPFRYFAAYKAVEKTAPPQVLDALENCLEISLGELPTFKGKVMSLCDNSGSAQGTTTSSMGTMPYNHIANLMAVLTGVCSEEGYIGVFGDRLNVYSIQKRKSVFEQVKEANESAREIGPRTENGIWLFLDKAIKEKEHYDHLFVYSDMQAGHGGLYGVDRKKYKDYIYPSTHNHIDVPKLINEYRAKVNPDIKVYLVQVAGYRNTLIPEFYDKTYILGGWSDKILKFANKMNKAT